MSGYRDDQEAARLRIDSLEDQLREHQNEIEQHREDLAARDREIARLGRELRSAGTTRVFPIRRRTSGARFMVAGAMTAATLAGTIGFLSVHRAVTPPTVTFAEFRPPNVPLTMPVVGRRGDGPDARPVDARTDAIVRARHMEDLDRILTSNASRNDLHALRDECLRTNDDRCVVAADKFLGTGD
jgi:hypothetical protein